jgi:hypothetical protein
MAHCKSFTTLDLTSGFSNLPIVPEHQNKTAFSGPDGDIYIWNPVVNSPAAFQRLVAHVLQGVLNVNVYIDDITIYTCTWAEHLSTLQIVFPKLCEADLEVEFQKCAALQPNARCLVLLSTSMASNLTLTRLRPLINCLILGMWRIYVLSGRYHIFPLAQSQLCSHLGAFAHVDKERHRFCLVFCVTKAISTIERCFEVATMFAYAGHLTSFHPHDRLVQGHSGYCSKSGHSLKILYGRLLQSVNMCWPMLAVLCHKVKDIKGECLALVWATKKVRQ